MQLGRPADQYGSQARPSLLQHRNTAAPGRSVSIEPGARARLRPFPSWDCARLGAGDRLGRLRGSRCGDASPAPSPGMRLSSLCISSRCLSWRAVPFSRSKTREPAVSDYRLDDACRVLFFDRFCRLKRTIYRRNRASEGIPHHHILAFRFVRSDAERHVRSERAFGAVPDSPLWSKRPNKNEFCCVTASLDNPPLQCYDEI